MTLTFQDMTTNCLTMCFYDGPIERPDFEKEAKRLQMIMDQWSYPLTHMSVGSEPGSVRIVGPKAGFNRLQRTDKHSVSGINLFSCPKGSTAPAVEWLLILQVSYNNKKKSTSMNIVGEGSISDTMLNTDFLGSIFNGKTYGSGFVHTLARDLIPEVYHRVGPMTKDEAADREDRSWQRFGYTTEKLGDRIRDLYLINYLSEAHLDRMVGSRTLREVLFDHGALNKRKVAGLSEFILTAEAVKVVRELIRPTGIAISLAP